MTMNDIQDHIIPEDRNSQRIYQEITTKMGWTEKCYLLTYEVNTVSLFSFQCFCMYKTTILQFLMCFSIIQFHYNIFSSHSQLHCTEISLYHA